MPHNFGLQRTKTAEGAVPAAEAYSVGRRDWLLGFALLRTHMSSLRLTSLPDCLLKPHDEPRGGCGKSARVAHEGPGEY